MRMAFSIVAKTRRMKQLSIGKRFLLWLGQPKAQERTHCINEKDHGRSGVSGSVRTDGAGHKRGQLSGQERGRGAEHTPADIGGKAFSGAAQMSRVHAWEIIAPKAELS